MLIRFRTTGPHVLGQFFMVPIICYKRRHFLYLQLETPIRALQHTSPLVSPTFSGGSSPDGGSNPIGTLQEKCTKNNWTSPVYKLLSETGEPHTKWFIYECQVCKSVYFLLSAFRASFKCRGAWRKALSDFDKLPDSLSKFPCIQL